MSKLLRDTIAQLAEAFVSGVLSAVRSASLEDLASETGRGRPAGRTAAAPTATAAPATKGAGRRGRGGRLRRRSPEDIAQVVQQIVSLLRSSSSGLRAEEIRAKLGLSAAELPRPISEALAARQITKTGEKRATRYFVGGGGGAKASARGGAKKRGKRRGKRGAKKS